MKKRNLESILREIQGRGVKEPETIRQYIQTLGDRTMYSLMYGDRDRCPEKERYEYWSYLEFVLIAYTEFDDYTDEEMAWCLKHMPYKDFVCLVDHLDDEDLKIPEPGREWVVRADTGIRYMKEAALLCLMKMLLRAKGRGDKDVGDFFVIHLNSLLEMVVNDIGSAGETDMVLDLLYSIRRELDPNQISLTNLDPRGCKAEFICLRKILVDVVEQVGFAEGFSLTGVLDRCRKMRAESEAVMAG